MAVVKSLHAPFPHTSALGRGEGRTVPLQLRSVLSGAGMMEFERLGVDWRFSACAWL